MMRNSRHGWGWVSRGLHWLMAIGILGQAWLGEFAHELARSPRKLDLMTWHKSIGITLLFLVVLRLVWSVLNRRPEPMPGTPRWQLRSAALSHGLLYLLMLFVPLTGWLYHSAKNVPFSLYRVIPWPSLIEPSEALADVFEELHETGVVLLLSLIAAHAAAALWHHFWRHDQVLRRMLFDRSGS